MQPTSTPLSPDARPDWRGVRTVAQTLNDFRTCIAVLVFYLIDAGLMALFCAFGAGNWASPMWIAGTGLVVAGGGAVLVHRFGGGRLDDPRLVIVQAGSALVVTLGVALFDPPLMALMLMTVIVIIPTAALRLAPGGLLSLCMVAAVASFAVVAAHGGRLTIPADTAAQQALSGMFLLWTLVKGASINLAGMALRMELNDSHERLAAALLRVEQLAERDELTGLPNRRRMQAALAEERERCSRNGVSFSVAMLDIDHFKRINDLYGHPMGDAVLRSVAQLMRTALRKPDLVGRVGGEEFLMILPGAARLEEAKHVVERVRAAIEGNDWSATRADLQVTASIGVAVGEPGESVESLFDRADRGLYLAKQGGRNQVAADTPRPH
ncbi:diguanylate cyclase [Leptothrix cholodnii SP-6]|uniref:diguanylate cyclase n=1 Tax=Leptothrix cholodnii (strain ATCC 51168 / LMG 8142 / SP-6) TaxID=395495 RepID=B1Y766_LEPCP|nr:diguanylate cyclase [Leptothrix cholodnii SP-6]